MDRDKRDLLTTAAAAAACLSPGLGYAAKKASADEEKKLPEFVLCDIGSLRAGESQQVNVNDSPWFLVTRRTPEDRRKIVDSPYDLKDEDSDRFVQPHNMKTIFRSAKEEIFVVFQLAPM